MEWAGIAKLGLWLALAFLALMGVARIKNAGRVEERLDQTEKTVEETADAARHRRIVDAARGVDAGELRRKWSKKPRVPGA